MNRLKQWLQLIPARLYLALGLASLVVSVVLAAAWLGLVTDREALTRQHRTALAETVAVTASTLLDDTEPAALAEVLRFMRHRNPELQSLGVRQQDGSLWVDVDGHAQHWQPQPSAAQAASALSVPLMRDGQPWGTVELQFAPLRPAGWLGWLADPLLRLTGFAFAACALLFYGYLARMLQQLDPSRSVPQRVRHALDTLTEGLLVLDARGRIVLANQSLAQVLGQAPQALVGKAASTIAWCDGQGAPLAAAALPWAVALRDGQVQRDVQIYLTSAAGPRCTLLSNCSPILGPNGVLQGVLVSLQDVTALEEKEIALKAAKEEADNANQAKSQFLANMSHEIRTPMNAILGFTDVLRRGGLKRGPEAARHLDIIHSSGRHLLNLINDILDLSKVEAGRLESEALPYAPHAVLHDVVRTLAVRAEEKGLALTLQFPQTLPAQLVGDTLRLRQILTNLIGNALKFTESGGTITVTARCDAGRYLIDVADSGVGIAPDRLEAVFEPFVQAEASTARRFGGTGLGLTISRGFARAMGGDITAASTLGQGTTFTVALPLPEGATELLDPQALHQAGEAAADVAVARWTFPPGKRVLVVDDAPENRQLLQVLLGDAGLTVLEAENGAIALDRVADGAPDIVLMDMQMPVMDGVAATRALRDRGCTLPVLALTANAMKGIEHIVRDAGFTGFHTKPIDVDALLQDLALRLGGQRDDSPPEPAAEAEPPPGTALLAQALPPAPSGAALPPMVSRLAHHPRLGKVVARFVQTLPPKLAEMQQALARDDMATLASLAHWLKGAGGSVGFDELFEPAKALDEAAKAHQPDTARAALHDLQALAARIAPVPTGTDQPIKETTT